MTRVKQSRQCWRRDGAFCRLCAIVTLRLYLGTRYECRETRTEGFVRERRCGSSAHTPAVGRSARRQGMGAGIENGCSASVVERLTL